MTFALVQSQQAQVFVSACMAATAISMFSFYEPNHTFEIEVVMSGERKPTGWRARVMNLEGFGVGYLASA